MSKSSGRGLSWVLLILVVGLASLAVVLAVLLGIGDDDPELVEVKITSEPASTPTVEPTRVIRTKKSTPERIPAPVVEVFPTATLVPTEAPTAVPTPIATATFTPEDMAVERLSEFAPWAVEPPDIVHKEIRSLLVELWLFDAGLAEVLVGIDWIADGVSREESEAIAVLAELARKDAGFASRVMGLPGVSSGTDASSFGAVHMIGLLYETDAELAKELLGLPWVVDGLARDELEMVAAMAATTSADAGLGRLIFEIPWLRDDLTSGELEAYLGVVSVAELNLDVARRIWELPWVGHGIETGTVELSALQALIAITETAGASTNAVLSVQFLTDPPNDYSAEVMGLIATTIGDLNDRDSAIAAEFVRHLETLDVRNDRDLDGFNRVVALIAADPEIGLHASSLPWTGNALLVWETELLAKVQEIVSSNREIGGLVLEVPWIADGVESKEAAQINELISIWLENPRLAGDIAFWPWIRDGLADDETDGVRELVLFHNEMVGERPIVADELLGFAHELRVESLAEIAAISALYEISRADVELALPSLRLEWLKDGVTESELGLLVFLLELADDGQLASDSMTLARRFVDSAWVIEGRTDLDPASMAAVLPLAEADAKLGEIALNWVWEGEDPVDFEGGAHGRVIELLGQLASLDIGVANFVFELPWLSDDRVGALEVVALEVLTRFAIEVAPTNRDLVENVVTHAGRLSFEREFDATGLESLLEIVRLNPATWLILSELSWLSDGITDEEDLVLFTIADYTGSSRALSGFALALPWVADGISGQEPSALNAVLGLGVADPVLADRVSGLGWVTDGIGEGSEEEEALAMLKSISGVDSGRARTVASFEWLVDGVDTTTVSALRTIADSLDVLSADDAGRSDRYLTLASSLGAGSAARTDTFFALSELITSDADSGMSVLDTRYFDDGEFSDDEISGLREVVRYMEWDPDFGAMVSNYEWVSDGVDLQEQQTLVHVLKFFAVDPELAAKAVNVGWIVEPARVGRTRHFESVGTLLEIAEIDPEFAGEMMEWDWVRDDLVYAEPNLLGIMNKIMSIDPAIAKQLPSVVTDGFMKVDEETLDIADATLSIAYDAPEIALSLLEDAQEWTPNITRFATRSVHWMMEKRQDDWDRLMDQSWYRDGVNVDEAVFLGALGSGVRPKSGTNRGSPDTFFDDMIISHHVQQQRLMLPLAGEATVWVVKHRPFEARDKLASDIATFAREVEGFFGQPFPVTDLIVVIAEDNSHWISGNQGDHVWIRLGGPHSIDVPGLVKTHLNTFYLGADAGKLWLASGAEDFFQEFPDEDAFDRREDRTREIREEYVRTYCILGEGIDDIQDAIDFSEAGQFVFNCGGFLGDLFLFDLAEVIGWDAFGKALGDIYQKSTDILTEPDGRFSVPEQFVYESFLGRAPQEAEADVGELYERLHNGRFLHPAETAIDFESLPEDATGPLLLSTEWRYQPDFGFLDENYLSALGALVEIWKIDEELAYELAQRRWVQGRVNYVVTDTLRKVADMASVDLGLAQWLFGDSTVDTSKSVNVRHVVDSILRIAKIDLGFAGELAQSRWMDEEWNHNFGLFLLTLAEFSAVDLDSARELIGSRLINDALESRERFFAENLRYAVRTEPRLLEHLVKLDWIWEAIGARNPRESYNHRSVLARLAELAEVDGDISLELVKVQWIQDEIDDDEMHAIIRLRHIAEEDVRRAGEVVRSSWFAEAVTSQSTARLDQIFNELRSR